MRHRWITITKGQWCRECYSWCHDVIMRCDIDVVWPASLEFNIYKYTYGVDIHVALAEIWFLRCFIIAYHFVFVNVNCGDIYEHTDMLLVNNIVICRLLLLYICYYNSSVLDIQLQQWRFLWFQCSIKHCTTQEYVCLWKNVCNV